MKNGKDKSMIYWRLNYKAKFKRNIWLIPVCILLTVWFLTSMPFGLKYTSIYLIGLWLIIIITTAYTYKRWKTEEKQDDTRML